MLERSLLFVARILNTFYGMARFLKYYWFSFAILTVLIQTMKNQLVAFDLKTTRKGSKKYPALPGGSKLAASSPQKVSLVLTVVFLLLS